MDRHINLPQQTPGDAFKEMNDRVQVIHFLFNREGDGRWIAWWPGAPLFVIEPYTPPK